jgi:hypothetical protein
MARANQASTKAIDAATYALFEDALARCHGNIQELARRMSSKDRDFPATTIYGWYDRGRVPFIYQTQLKKILRKPRTRRPWRRARSAEARV